MPLQLRKTDSSFGILTPLLRAWLMKFCRRTFMVCDILIRAWMIVILLGVGSRDFTVMVMIGSLMVEILSAGEASGREAARAISLASLACSLRAWARMIYLANSGSSVSIRSSDSSSSSIVTV